MQPCLPLLDLLSDGRFHSGRALGERLGIARTTVWNHVRALEALGLDIHAVRGRGYRLAHPIERLDATQIESALPAATRLRLGRIHVLADVDSTNRWLAAACARGETPPASVCVAERQSAGRGRRGRDWVSPFGRNLYLSLAWPFDVPAHRLRGLSLALGVAVAEACESLGARGVALKWPNDLVGPGGEDAARAGRGAAAATPATHAWGGKLGGLLVELSTRPGGATHGVVGIGLNVDVTSAMREAIAQPVDDLARLCAEPPSRNRLAAAVLAHLVAALPRFELEGLAPFRARFAERDATFGRDVVVVDGGRRRHGRASGVDENGALRLETADGLVAIDNGDVSLRSAT